MSTLKVNKLRDTAGSADAITLDPNGGAVLAGVTTVTSVKVGAAVTISESGIEASGIGITCANINGTQIGGRRNIIINGAMLMAQRGTSSTTQSGYGSVDRMSVYQANTSATITSSQVDVASGTPAYQSGFRKAIQITKGAGTAATNSQINLSYQIEAQDIANSGWDYTNPNSFLTFSFWVKTSVANHNPQVAFIDMDSSQGGSKNYQFEVPTLTANTWTKIIHSIPGHADQVYDNNNAVGIHFYIYPWLGTDFTDNSNTMNAWSSFGTKDIDTTWLTTNNSTFQVTGMQLEVGSQATPFEHRSLGEELALCQRYFYRHGDLSGTNPSYSLMGVGMIGHNGTTDTGKIQISSPVRMRTQPTATAIPSGAEFIIHTGSGDEGTSDMYCNSAPALWTGASGDTNFWVDFERTSGGSPDQGIACMVYANNNGANIGFDAEL